MYFLRTENRGNVVTAHKEEQQLSPADANWTEVQRWAAQLEPPCDLKAQLPSGALLFFDRSTLADFCRSYGVMLHVTGTNFTPGFKAIHATQEWTSLQRAVGPSDPRTRAHETPTALPQTSACCGCRIGSSKAYRWSLRQIMRKILSGVFHPAL
jgi:hypothetical protein